MNGGIKMRFINQKNLLKIKKALAKRADDDEPNRNELNHLEKSLNSCLTSEELYLFNTGRFFEVTPIIFMFEFVSQTGIIEIERETTHRDIILWDCGLTVEEYEEEVEKLGNTWKDLLKEEL